MKKNNRIGSVVKAVDGLSLGISIVVAVIFGVFLGKALSYLYPPLFWLGVIFGILAAISNVYKAYKSQVRMWEEERIKRENIKDSDW